MPVVQSAPVVRCLDIKLHNTDMHVSLFVRNPWSFRPLVVSFHGSYVVDRVRVELFREYRNSRRMFPRGLKFVKCRIVDHSSHWSRMSEGFVYLIKFQGHCM